MPSYTSQLENPRPWTKLLIGGGGVLGLLFAFLILWPFYSVDAGYVGVKTWFSAPESETLAPGIHFIVPISESVHEVTVQPQLAQTQETASTNDQQDVGTTVSVNYQIDPAQAVVFWSKYRDTSTLASTIIAPIVSNDVKATTANYNAQELLTKRGQVREEIESAIRSDLAPYGVVIITGVNITDFHYSDQYNQAIENKQVAQQNAQAEEYKLQQVQVSTQQQVAQAEAQASAAVDIAKGNAQATILQAQADAAAYTLKQKALTPLLVEQALVDKWNGQLPTFTSSTLPTTIFGMGNLAASASNQAN